ncbi:MAG: hypothetical protein K0R55_4480 [Sporomusa sp.]|jgi:hypothetical protein|nr:hypothetical protein [Sporomusa sp.]
MKYTRGGNVIASGQNIDDAAVNFKAGVDIANQALAKAKQILS